MRAEAAVPSAFEPTVASLRRMGLIAANEMPVITPLTGGVSSRILRIDSTHATFCFKQALAQLNVTAEWYAPVERNRAEVAWLREANTIMPGIAPEILAEDLVAHAFAMEFLDTAAFPVWKTQLLAGTIAVSTAAAIGRGLVAIHAATAGNDAIARCFANDSQFADLRIDPYLLATAKIHRDIAHIVERIAATTEYVKLTLIHGDITPKNILVGGACSVMFLDAECATYGDPSFDLSFCLNHLLLKAAAQPSHASALRAAFRSLTESYMAGVSWEPTEGFEQRAVPLLSALMLSRIDGKSPVEYLDDSARDRVRSFARRGLTAPFPSLEELSSTWFRDLQP